MKNDDIQHTDSQLNPYECAMLNDFDYIMFMLKVVK